MHTLLLTQETVYTSKHLVTNQMFLSKNNFTLVKTSIFLAFISKRSIRKISLSRQILVMLSMTIMTSSFATDVLLFLLRINQYDNLLNLTFAFIYKIITFSVSEQFHMSKTISIPSIS